jgi:hypothetical protein
VNEDFMLRFFTDLDYLRGETAAFLEKLFFVYFAIPLLNLVLYKFPKGSSLLDMTY